MDSSPAARHGPARRTASFRRGAAVAVLALAGSVAVAQGPVPLGDEFRVNTTTASAQGDPSVAMAADGTFVVVWQSYRQLGPGAFDADIYAQRYNAAGVALGGEFHVNATTAGDQSTPSVAVAADGAFVVAWSSGGQDGSGFGVYAQRYDAAGAALGDEFRINTTTTGNQSIQSVAMAPGGAFVVAWQSETSSTEADVFAQRYSAAGEPQGPEFRVNTHTPNFQGDPAVAMALDGAFVVAWTSTVDTGSGLPGQDGSGSGVYAQRYSAAGVAQGPEFRVNTYTESNQGRPSVAMDSGGAFVVAWESQIQFTPISASPGVFAQRYSAAGVPLGGEFRVNTYVPDIQGVPSVAMALGGGFVVAWESSGQDGSQNGVYAQQYTASGAAVGGEFRVNTTTAENQRLPSVAMAADGAFVVAWEGNGPGDVLGVFAQRYSSGPVASEPSASAALALVVAPNPVASGAVVRYETPEAGPVRLAVSDVLGREVAVLWDGAQGAGAHEARLDAGRLAPGVYLVRLSAGASSTVRRVTVAR